MLQDRRTFLATVGAAALGAAAACRTAASVKSARKLDRIGIQLYTLRTDMARDLAGTVARVAAIGYKEVEFAGYFNRTPAQIRAILDQHRLTSPSTHLSITEIEKDPPKAFADAKVIGHEWLTVPSLPGRLATVDDWKAMAVRFNGLARQAKAAGLRLAFHNHNAEFRKIGDVVPFDILVQETDPALVDFEMDLYWVVNAGSDPLDYFNRFPGRFKLLHVKDSMGAPDHKMASVGAGTIDFKTIFAQSAKAGAQHYFVEHDQPADPLGSAEASFRYLNSLSF